jgi:hypothetical protein
VRFGAGVVVGIALVASAGCGGVDPLVTGSGSDTSRAGTVGSSSASTLRSPATRTADLGGCGADSRRVVDTKTGLSWTPPDEWSTGAEQPGNFGIITSRVGPTGDTSQPDAEDFVISWSIPERAATVYGEPSADTLDAYARNIAQNMVEFNTSATADAIDVSTSPTMISNSPAVWLHFRQERKPRMWMSGVVTISRGSAVALVGSTEVEANVPELNSIVGTACIVE